MKRLLQTDPADTVALIIRLTLGLVVFPHGAQKMLGWFGGNGYSETIAFFTGEFMGLPLIIAILVILIEFFGTLLLIAGFLTRIAALGIIGLFVGIIFTVHLENGFFMNWYGEAGRGHGIEFHLLILGLALASLISGGGRWSVDAWITGKHKK